MQISVEYAPGLHDWNGSIPIVDTGTTLYVAQSPRSSQYFSALMYSANAAGGFWRFKNP